MRLLCIQKKKLKAMVIETGRIEKGDRMFASMTKSGQVLAELKGDTSISAMSDVYRALRLMSPTVKGFVKVSVSNRTRGWTKTLSLLLGRGDAPRSHAMSRRDMIDSGLMESDGQLRIQFN